MSGYGTFRHKLFPGPNGKHLSPYLPSRTEDTLWDQFQGVSSLLEEPRGQGPQLSVGRQGVQLRERDSPKRRGGKGKGQLGDFPRFIRTAVLRV